MASPQVLKHSDRFIDIMLSHTFMKCPCKALQICSPWKAWLKNLNLVRLDGTFVHVRATSVVIEGKLKVKHQRKRTSTAVRAFEKIFCVAEEKVEITPLLILHFFTLSLDLWVTLASYHPLSHTMRAQCQLEGFHLITHCNGLLWSTSTGFCAPADMRISFFSFYSLTVI